jgi:type III secretory pathway component EscT
MSGMFLIDRYVMLMNKSAQQQALFAATPTKSIAIDALRMLVSISMLHKQLHQKQVQCACQHSIPTVHA